MARAITSEELAILRSKDQWSKLGLVFSKPVSVYTALVNQSSFSDPVTEITYDGGAGTLANVKIGMTVWIGSTAGAYDKGKCRIRKTPSGIKFYIGETSEIVWSNNLYITIVNEVGLWAKHLITIGTNVWMDYDVNYSDQHDDCNPVPVLGPDTAIKLTGESITHQRDASGSWVPGSTISSYSWSASGPASVGIDNDALADPTFTFTTTGRYLISCIVTAANGKTTTGYRVTEVYSSPSNDFVLKSCGGSYDDGGWEFSVKMLGDADIDDVVDGALVFLVSEDYYNDVPSNLGYLDGYENVIAVGHIDGDSISVVPDGSGDVEFTASGAHYWLKKLEAYALGIENKTSTATAWTNFEDLTVDDGLWHLLHWRSTATICMDIVSLTNDTKNLPSAEASGAENLWEQIKTISWNTILAVPVCDRYGRLFIEIEPQLVPADDRTSFPVIQTITDQDWFDIIDIERVSSSKTSLIDMSGVSYDGSDATPLLSKAQGATYSRYGEVITIDSLLLSSQSQLNELSGNYYAWENNEYPNVDTNLAQINKFIDICPRQYVVMNLDSADTPRGIAWVNKKFFPRKIDLVHEQKSGKFYVEITFEAETIGSSGVTVKYVKTKQSSTYTYDSNYSLDDYNLPVFTIPGFLPSYNDSQPDETSDDDDYSEDEATCPTDAPENGPYRAIGGCTLTGNDKYKVYGNYGCVIRTSSHDHRTQYSITARFQELVDGVWTDTDADDFYNIYAVASNGSVIATGSHNAVSGNLQRTGYFDAVVATEIAYVLLEMDGDKFTPTGTVTFQTVNGTVETIEERAYQNGTSHQIYCRYKFTMHSLLPGLPNWEIRFSIPGLAESNAIVTGNVIFAESDGDSLIKGFQYEDYGSPIYWAEIGNFVVSNTYYLARAFEFNHTFQYDGVRIRSNTDWTEWNQTVLFDVVVILGIKLVPTHRILLEGVDLYNICPRST